jgi:hypothetical protein
MDVDDTALLDGVGNDAGVHGAVHTAPAASDAGAAPHPCRSVPVAKGPHSHMCVGVYVCLTAVGMQTDGTGQGGDGTVEVGNDENGGEGEEEDDDDVRRRLCGDPSPDRPLTRRPQPCARPRT